MAHDRTTPCGSLPQTHVAVHLFYCEHHLAWSLHLHHYRETGELIEDVGPFTVVEFGPFDDAHDVAMRALGFIAECTSRDA